MPTLSNCDFSQNGKIFDEINEEIQQLILSLDFEIDHLKKSNGKCKSKHLLKEGFENMNEQVSTLYADSNHNNIWCMNNEQDLKLENPGVRNCANFSQEILDRQIQILERKYGGGVKVRRAASTIQQAYRKHSINKNFERLKYEKLMLLNKKNAHVCEKKKRLAALAQENDHGTPIHSAHHYLPNEHERRVYISSKRKNISSSRRKVLIKIDNNATPPVNPMSPTFCTLRRYKSDNLLPKSACTEAQTDPNAIQFSSCSLCAKRKRIVDGVNEKRSEYLASNEITDEDSCHHSYRNHTPPPSLLCSCLSSHSDFQTFCNREEDCAGCKGALSLNHPAYKYNKSVEDVNFRGLLSSCKVSANVFTPCTCFKCSSSSQVLGKRKSLPKQNGPVCLHKSNENVYPIPANDYSRSRVNKQVFQRIHGSSIQLENHYTEKVSSYQKRFERVSSSANSNEKKFRMLKLKSLEGKSTKNEIIRKRHYRICLNFFNRKPSRGIDLLVKFKFLQDDPLCIALFLKNCKGLSKCKIGEYLGNIQSSKNLEVLKHFCEQIDFYDLEIDVAFRKFQSYFHLPGEAQKIEKVVEAFSERYAACNPQKMLQFCSKDSVFILAFAIVMLNTDLHTPNLKDSKRMKLSEFLKNLKGIDGGRDINIDTLSGVYYRIKTEELKPENDHVLQISKLEETMTGKNKPLLALPHRRLVCYCRLIEIFDLDKKDKGTRERDCFLFNDLLVLAKNSNKSTKHNTPLYIFKNSFFLCNVQVRSFSTENFKYVIQLLNRGDNSILITFNAKSQLDKSNFLGDLKESIVEMREMEKVQINSFFNETSKSIKSSIHDQNKIAFFKADPNFISRDSGVVEDVSNTHATCPSSNQEGNQQATMQKAYSNRRQRKQKEDEERFAAHQHAHAPFKFPHNNMLKKESRTTSALSLDSGMSSISSVKQSK